jgi:hypothetical protein
VGDPGCSMSIANFTVLVGGKVLVDWNASWHICPNWCGRVKMRFLLQSWLAEGVGDCGGCVARKWKGGGARVGSLASLCFGRFPGAPSVLAQMAPSVLAQGLAPSEVVQGLVQLKILQRGV